jgi:hypothetical protein
LASPIQFRRTQYAYISSNIEHNCSNSFSIIRKWAIKQCSSYCSYEIPLDLTGIDTKLSELYIPPRTLDYGVYELQLNVTIIASTNLVSSASAFIKIIPSGITANLIQLGTSMITRGHQQELKLDPGHYSFDADGYILVANVKFVIKLFLLYLFSIAYL